MNVPGRSEVQLRKVVERRKEKIRFTADHIEYSEKTYTT